MTGAPLPGTAAPAASAPSSRDRWPLGGALLVVAGGWLLARQVVALSVASLALVTGAVLVLGWLRTRRPALLVLGAPVTGAALGLVLGDLLPAGSAPTLLLAGLAAGYGSAALAQRWTALPAAGAAALALAASDLRLAELVPPRSAVVALGLAVSGLGAVLVLRPRLPLLVAGASSAALLLVGVVALSAVVQTAVVQGAVPSTTAGADLVRTTLAVPLPELEGRRLVVLAPTAELVVLNGPTVAEATVERAAGRPGATVDAVAVTEHADRVEVRAATLPGATVSLVLTLGREVSASILGGTADVLADLQARDLEIDTTSGAVSAALSMADGDEVVVRSDTGDIDVRVTGSPRLTAEAPVLFVDGYGEPRRGLRRFAAPGGAGTLTTVTRSGRAAVVAVPARTGGTRPPGAPGARRPAR